MIDEYLRVMCHASQPNNTHMAMCCRRYRWRTNRILCGILKKINKYYNSSWGLSKNNNNCDYNRSVETSPSSDVY